MSKRDPLEMTSMLVITKGYVLEVNSLLYLSPNSMVLHIQSAKDSKGEYLDEEELEDLTMKQGPRLMRLAKMQLDMEVPNGNIN